MTALDQSDLLFIVFSLQLYNAFSFLPAPPLPSFLLAGGRSHSVPWNAPSSQPTLPHSQFVPLQRRTPLILILYTARMLQGRRGG